MCIHICRHETQQLMSKEYLSLKTKCLKVKVNCLNLSLVTDLKNLNIYMYHIMLGKRVELILA